MGADVAQRRRELGHQRVAGVLADHPGDRSRVYRRQLLRAPGAFGGKALPHPRGHRSVAAEARALADRRPPAGAEVDRVHADREGGGVFPVVTRRRLRCRFDSRVPGQARRVCLDLTLDDADVPRPLHHPGTGSADFVGKGDRGHGPVTDTRSPGDRGGRRGDRPPPPRFQPRGDDRVRPHRWHRPQHRRDRHRPPPSTRAWASPTGKAAPTAPRCSSTSATSDASTPLGFLISLYLRNI
jgi:hypothetical protein